ncbi:MAG: response regulator [Deltaproteobacteria bacterium]|nr:response regulator [Deltaproteobacteria bacterium]
MDHAPRPHLLIVEDDFEVRAMLAEMLASEGYEIDMASNGAEAITLFEGGARPCAVLVDLLMPGIVGQELLEYLRADDQLAAIPVAIVSASPQLAPEGYTVFSKPLELGQLREFLRNDGSGICDRHPLSHHDKRSEG